MFEESSSKIQKVHKRVGKQQSHQNCCKIPSDITYQMYKESSKKTLKGC